MISWMTAVFAVLLGTDVMIKQQVEENLDLQETRELPGGRVVIRKVYNRGFLMNLLDGHEVLVKGASIAASIGILIWDILVFWKKGSFLKKLGLTLLSAGAASNTFDRLARGKVIDYIGIRTGKKLLARITANLGDIYIACGGLLFMAGELIPRRIH